MKLPGTQHSAARAATRCADDVIVSGTVSAADAVVEPDAALYVTMRRGGAPQAAFSKFKAVPEPSLAAVRIPMKGKSFPIDFSIPRSALFPDAPALPDEIKDVALTVSARLDQDGVAATRGPDDLVGSVYTTPSSAPAAIALGRGAAMGSNPCCHLPTLSVAREPSSGGAPGHVADAGRAPAHVQPPHVRAVEAVHVGHVDRHAVDAARLDEPAPADGLLEGAARAGVLHVVQHECPAGPRRADGVGNVPRRPFVGVVAVD